MSLHACGINPPLDLSPQQRELKPQGTLDFPCAGVRRALRPRPRPFPALALARRVRGHPHPVRPADGGDPRRPVPPGRRGLHRRQRRCAAQRQHRHRLRDTLAGVQPEPGDGGQGHRLCQKVHHAPGRVPGLPGLCVRPAGRSRDHRGLRRGLPRAGGRARRVRVHGAGPAFGGVPGAAAALCGRAFGQSPPPQPRRGAGAADADLHPGPLRPSPSPWPRSPGPPASASGSACAALARPSMCRPCSTC